MGLEIRPWEQIFLAWGVCLLFWFLGPRVSVFVFLSLGFLVDRPDGECEHVLSVLTQGLVHKWPSKVNS